MNKKQTYILIGVIAILGLVYYFVLLDHEASWDDLDDLAYCETFPVISEQFSYNTLFKNQLVAQYDPTAETNRYYDAYNTLLEIFTGTPIVEKFRELECKPSWASVHIEFHDKAKEYDILRLEQLLRDQNYVEATRYITADEFINEYKEFIKSNGFTVEEAVRLINEQIYGDDLELYMSLEGDWKGPGILIVRTQTIPYLDEIRKLIDSSQYASLVDKELTWR